MVDIISKLTKRKSRELRGQVGDPGTWQPLMGMAEGPVGPRGCQSGLRPLAPLGAQGAESGTGSLTEVGTPPFFPLSFS